MKTILTIFAFVLTFQTVVAQDKSAEEQSNKVIRVELKEADASKAKSLSAISNGKLLKGESITTFLIEASEENVEAVKNELKNLFPTCKLEEVKD